MSRTPVLESSALPQSIAGRDNVSSHVLLSPATKARSVSKVAAESTHVPVYPASLERSAATASVSPTHVLERHVPRVVSVTLPQEPVSTTLVTM